MVFELAEIGRILDHMERHRRVDAADLVTDLDRRFAVERMLALVVDLVVHEYLDIDLEIVAGSVPLALDGFRSYVTAVALFITEHEEQRRGSAQDAVEDS